MKDIIEDLQFYRENCIPDMASGNYETLDNLLVRAITEINWLRTHHSMGRP